MTFWVLVASFGCYGLKLAGLSLPRSLLEHARVQRIAALLPVAMLSALVTTDLLTSNRHYSFDWRLLVGVGMGAVALRLQQSLIVVFLVAVAATALLRLISL
jgi:branched-subunit amino acid transport protein